MKTWGYIALGIMGIISQVILVWAGSILMGMDAYRVASGLIMLPMIFIFVCMMVMGSGEETRE